MNGTAKVPLRSGDRELRLDFVRGLALLIIFSDHLTGNVLSLFTPMSTGFSSMAEVFLFVFGYVSAVVYGRMLRERGFAACQKKATLRATQLYVAHVVTTFVVCGVLWIVKWIDPSIIDFAGYGGFSALIAKPASAIASIGNLTYLANDFGILPLYSVLLLLLPGVLWLACRRGWPVLVASIAVYSGVQFRPDLLRLPEPWRGLWLFNPWAWQLCFFLGAAVGNDDRLRRWMTPRHWITIGTALAVLEVSFIVMAFLPDWRPPLIGKGNCEPLRMIHFWSLVIVGRAVLSECTEQFCRRFAWPVALCGQNGLVTYCAGAILSTVGSIALVAADFSAIAQILTNVLGWTFLVAIAFAYGMCRGSTRFAG